jgi:hypothetical protein
MNKIWIFLAPKNINDTTMALVLRETEFVLKIIFHIGFLLHLTGKIQVKSPNGIFEYFRHNLYNVNHLQNLAGP